MQSVCQKCKKALATIHLTEISAGEKRERHFCERCAREEGIKHHAQQHIPLNEMLTKFVLQTAGVQQLGQLTCKECGMSFNEFRNVGLLGCPHDYDAFESALFPLLQRAHDGGTHHVGKSPRSPRETPPAGPQDEAARVRRELEAAIAQEDFERAARLRDRLRALESP